MAVQTRNVIVATLALDAALFLVNMTVFLVGGSRAVLSQALYSITDVIAGIMIYWGVRASLEPPTHTHPFGRGKERFFWAFTAGLVTFSIAGALVFVEGVLQIFQPTHIYDLTDAFVSVGATLVAAAASLSVVLWEMRKEKTTIQEIMESEHQDFKIVLMQDLIGLVGATVAMTGIYMVYRMGTVFFDGLAAAVVGAMLLGTGFVFALDARELLVGKGVSAGEGKVILSIVERYPYVRRVEGMQSMLMGPDELLVALRINFADELVTDDLEMHIDQLRRFVMGESPRIRQLLIEPVAETSGMTLRERMDSSNTDYGE
jgi:cation diffusion facilitator family transporter